MSSASSSSTANGGATHISGYLHKKTRDGRWQKRWFETNANFLTYYKSKKMTKLLAALNLPQVGEIAVVGAQVDVEGIEEESGGNGDSDRLSGSSKTSQSSESTKGNDGSFFTIELNERIYTLKADTPSDCLRWVQTLNALKLAGIQSTAGGVGGGVGDGARRLADIEKTPADGKRQGVGGGGSKGCVPCCGTR
jgi:hypothetical protein